MKERPLDIDKRMSSGRIKEKKEKKKTKQAKPAYEGAQVIL